MNRWRRLGSLLALGALLGFGFGARGATAQDANESHPAHIHSGSCAQLGDVVYPLTNVSPSGMMAGMQAMAATPGTRHAERDGDAGRIDDESGDGGDDGHSGRDEPDPRQRLVARFAVQALCDQRP